MVVLALAGWSLIFRISFTQPGGTPSQTLVVSTAYPGASAMEVEEKITNSLEGRLSLVPEIDNLRSYSTSGQSRIEVSIMPEVDLLVVERKIRMMCRLESRSFPQNAGSASVAFEGSAESKPAMKVNIHSTLSQDSLYRWLEPRLAMRIGGLPHSEKIEYPDLCQPMIGIDLFQARLETAGISAFQVRKTIETVARELALAQSTDVLPTIRWSTIRPSSRDLDSLFVQNQNRTSFRLAEFIRLTEKEDCKGKRWRDGQAMFGVELFFHPNGWTRSNLSRMEEVFDGLKKETGGAIDIEMIENNLGDSLHASRRILIQCGFSVAILAILLLLTSGKRQSLFLLMLLLGSLGLSFLALYLLDLPLSVSVIGGLTLGLGMASDNGIMVLGGQKSGNEKRLILPLLAATLTTLVPLILVQWIEIPIIKAMSGFGMALSLVLCASLVVCWAILPMVEQHLVLNTRPIHVATMGSRLISRIRQDRKWLYVGLVLLIGIPVPDLPERIYVKDQAFAELYRNTIGSYEVQYIWQPRILDWIGGLSRPFNKQVQRGESASGTESEAIELVLKGRANIGSYPEQICDLSGRIEQEILWKQIPGIRLTRSCGLPSDCMIMIQASRSHTGLSQVEELYRWLITRIKGTSGIAWSLSGVGKGWSNERIPDQPWQVKLQGYHYVQLMRRANQIADSLRSLPGVMDAYVGQPERQESSISYRLNLQQLAQASRNPHSFQQEAGMQGGVAGQMLRTKNGHTRMVPFSMQRNPPLSLSSFLDGPSSGESDPSPRSRYVEQDTLMDSPEIYKENQVYEIQLNWSYVGSVKMGERLEKALRERLKNEPLTGFKLKPKSQGPVWDLRFLSVLIWLIPILGIMWVICAVFLESLRFAFLVLLSIPFGLIGAMAFIILTNGSLDAGAVAGFFLVTGLTVNHTIFLLMPLRTMRKPSAVAISHIYQHKMRPIILTMLSTVLTFGPFCFLGGEDRFWSSLAFITMSGLFSSVVLTLVCLPAFLRMKS